MFVNSSKLCLAERAVCCFGSWYKNHGATSHISTVLAHWDPVFSAAIVDKVLTSNRKLYEDLGIRDAPYIR